MPSVEPIVVPATDGLEDISGWLGTFRERLRQARAEQPAGVLAAIEAS